MEIKTLGIDIAKRVFQLHRVDERGKTVLKKRLSRDQPISLNHGDDDGLILQVLVRP